MDSTNQSQEVITTLYNEFSGILQMPIYIKLFADAFTSFSNFNENNFGELISRWYKILLQKISENNTHQDELVCDDINFLYAILLRYEVRNVTSPADLPHSGKTWFRCETSTMMKLVFLPLIYSWWASTC